MLPRYARLLLLPFLAALLVSEARGQSALYGITSCCPNEVVAFDPTTGDATPIATIGDADDAFVGTVGSGVFDAGSRTVYLVRNGLLVAVALDAGTVTEIGPATAFSQFAGFDAARGVIYAFTTETAQVGQDSVAYTNRIIALDPADASATEVAVVGEGLSTGEGYEGALFSTVSGPAIVGTDPFRLLTIRNGGLLAVELPSGDLDDTPSFGGGQLLAHVPGADAVLTFDTFFEPTDGDPTTGTFTNTVRERDLTDGTVTAEVVVGTATIGEGGSFEGDTFTASLGMAVYDATSDRVYLNRNARLVAVDVADGNVTAYASLGSVRVVGSAPAATTDASEEGAAPSISAIAYPNPFRDTAQLEVTLDRPQEVEIAVYDLLGRRVTTLHRGSLPAGTFTHEGIGRALPAGAYFVRVRGETVSEVLRLTRLD